MPWLCKESDTTERLSLTHVNVLHYWSYRDSIRESQKGVQGCLFYAHDQSSEKIVIRPGQVADVQLTQRKVLQSKTHSSMSLKIQSVIVCYYYFMANDSICLDWALGKGLDSACCEGKTRFVFKERIQIHFQAATLSKTMMLCELSANTKWSIQKKLRICSPRKGDTVNMNESLAVLDFCPLSY